MKKVPNRKERRSKKQKLFDPTSLATSIEADITRDFSNPTYGGSAEDRITKFRAEVQKKSTLKKFVDPSAPQDAALEQKAFDKFLTVRQRLLRQQSYRQVQRHCAPFWSVAAPTRHVLDAGGEYYVGLNAPHTHHILCDSNRVGYRLMTNFLIGRMRKYIHLILGEVTGEEVYENVKHSHGSSIGVPFVDTSLEAKNRFPLTATECAAVLFNDYLRYDEVFVEALLSRNFSTSPKGAMLIVEGSRATTVEKTVSERRMIAVEPTVNMMFQQGLMAIMYDRLEAVGYGLARLPEYHKEYAKFGSITGLLATIDFSSASDTIPLRLVEETFPESWLYWMRMSRSPRMEIPGRGLITLPMYATMGNATTFPVESLILLALAHAVADEMDRSKPNLQFGFCELRAPHKGNIESAETISVFGDDCIIPTKYAKCFIYFAERLGFRVNKEKSFYDVKCRFRESCGGDYYHGYDVRPFFLKGPPGALNKISLEAWLYKTWNLAQKKYIPYFGGLSYLYDKNLFRRLSSTFAKHNILIKVVPDDFPDDSGLKIFHDLDRWIEHYPSLRFSPVGQDEHGTYHFKFLRFVYDERRKWADLLRYAGWLKMPTASRPRTITVPGQEDDHQWYKTRKKGKYVVAETTSYQM